MIKGQFCKNGDNASYKKTLHRPIKHDTTGKYECTDYHCSSCCATDINTAAYSHPLNKIGKFVNRLCNIENLVETQS